MAATTDTLADSSLEALDEACARNLAAEIHFDRSDTLCTAKMRLLRIRDGKLWTESAQAIGKTVAFRPDEPIAVYFILNDLQYVFYTRVLEPVVPVQLNERMKVTGMVLRTPEKISQQQRRHDFRVSLAKYDIRVDVHEAVPNDLSCCPIDARRFTGRLVNISAGGAGLVVTAKDWPRFSMNDPLYMSFSLAADDEPFHLVAEVRHFRRIHDDSAFQIGMQFLSVDGLAFRIAQRRIRNFVTTEQRKRIKVGR